MVRCPTTSWCIWRREKEQKTWMKWKISNTNQLVGTEGCSRFELFVGGGILGRFRQFEIVACTGNEPHNCEAFEQARVHTLQLYLMFRKGDFQRVQLLGSGKKHTKIYKAIHKQTGKVYAIKEIEAKSMDKLNEYKEEAVQLVKVQNNPNVIKFFGYYFSETMYGAFRLNLVTEFMDHILNMETIYRKRKKANQFWKEKELVIMFCSLVSTCAFLQNIGICHRDIKPANIFILPNGEMKLIDFGESKDYVYDLEDEDKNTFTMATIRGTPQYLSPILWKAHVVDGQSRYAEHNIYKSDVFSTGLVLFQMASMNEVSGFNSKTNQVNGEELVKEKLKSLQKMYSPSLVQLLDLVLRFEESERPSFSEIEQLFLNKEVMCKESGKPCSEYIKFYNQNYNNLTKNNTAHSNTVGINSHLNSLREKPTAEHKEDRNSEDESKEEKSKDKERVSKSKNKEPSNYYKDSTLILNENCYWFEFGGCGIGRFNINKLKWKVDSEEKSKRLPEHFVVVYVPDTKSYCLLGGPAGENFRIFKSRRLEFNKAQIPGVRNFFSAVHYNHRMYLFGGYNDETKTQMSSCLMYDIHSEKWSEIASMKTARSFSSCCKINDNEILVIGGYNKDKGTLNSIEKYNLKSNTFEVLDLKLPLPLRRFMTAKVSKNVALVFGGITKESFESQRVFKLNYEKLQFVELEGLEKGGVIENEILVDSEGHFHLFLEHANGTSPHAHIKYRYDPHNEKYATKMD